MYQLIITDDKDAVILIDYWRCIEVKGVQYEWAVRTFKNPEAAWQWIKEQEG